MPILERAAAAMALVSDPSADPSFRIDGVPAVHANAIEVHFRRRAFDRQKSIIESRQSNDPPQSAALIALNTWIERMAP